MEQLKLEKVIVSLNEKFLSYISVLKIFRI